MSTLAAFEPRPYIFPRSTTEIELVVANPSDLKLHDPVKEKDVLRINLIFWLKSSITGKILNTPNILTEETSRTDLKNWLELNMIYIAKYPFK